MEDTFVRKAHLVRAIDGDTYEFRIDLGYRAEIRIHGRLRNYNAPEMSTPEGEPARRRAEAILSNAYCIFVRSYKDKMSFARWIVDVEVDGVDLVHRLNQPPLPHSEFSPIFGNRVTNTRKSTDHDPF